MPILHMNRMRLKEVSLCPRSCSPTSLHQVPTGVDSRALALSTIYTEKQVHIVF